MLMAARFLEEEVLAATGGRIARPGAVSNYAGISIDTRQPSQGTLFVALRGERFDAHDFLGQAAAEGAFGAVVRRGGRWAATPVGFALYEVEDTLAALGALARHHRQRFRLPVAAITGSNGKTTTKEMVFSILATRGPALKSEGNLNNEVGLPLTLLRLQPAHVAAVVEMGMNHPGEIGRLTAIAQPDAGMITAVQPAHLKGLGTLEAIASAKGELFRGLPATATAVINLDDANIVTQAALTQAKRITFGLAEGAQVRLVRSESRSANGLSAAIAFAGAEYAVRLHFVGEHNAQNAAGAFALATALGYSPEECIRGLEAARPQAHRLRLVPTVEGVTLLDDSYNANPCSTAAALQTLRGLAASGRAVAVLGDMLELGAAEASEHHKMGELAAQSADVVAFFGPRSRGAHLAAARLGSNAAHFEDLERLLDWLRPRLAKGDLVLVKGSRGMRLERVVHQLGGREGEGMHP
jgi:UDP-N-acetylmuramoyl-tripeptide--D-alanyl-D-alanine ligase